LLDPFNCFALKRNLGESSMATGSKTFQSPTGQDPGRMADAAPVKGSIIRMRE